MKITYFYRNHKAGYSIKKVSDLYVNKMENKEVFEMPSQYASIKSILQNIWYTFKHRNKRGINHITGDIHYCIIPLMFCKTVLTIHDTCVYDRAKGFKKIIFKYFWYKIPLMLATKIVCISESTKHSIMRFTKRTDISIIYNAVDPHIHFSEKQFDTNFPKILLIGTNWNKNITRTLIALSVIKCHVTIIGELSKEHLETISRYNISYTNKTHLTDEEINAEYQNTDIVSFCSEYEGFGMPIIEANATGRIVITSNITPMTEIGGESAIYVNPYNIEEIRLAFKYIISNESIRSKHIELGINNIKRFNLNSIVEQYKNLYRTIMRNT